MPRTRVSFGRDVLGPIFAEFALRLWMYLSGLSQSDQAALLFCARGGLRLQLIYERFLAASGLESPVPASAFMVSRVVAVRPALLAGVDSAFEQIAYEFSVERLCDVAKAVSGIDPLSSGDAVEDWRRPYSRTGLREILSSPAGHTIREGIQQQTDRFRRHLDFCSAGRRRVIICDTGLFGSTVQLLEEGMPDYSWSAALFARANYKHLPAPHFVRTVGLSIESDQYSPLHARTAALRYWHLIESTLEPDLPSVRSFEESDGLVRSNLEIEGWQERILPASGETFAGIIEYIDSLPRDSFASRIIMDAAPAWVELRRAVVWPALDDAKILDTGSRSVDFGRDGTVSVMPASSIGLMGSLRSSLWREGDIARVEDTRPSATARGHRSRLRDPLVSAHGPKHEPRLIASPPKVDRFG